jgi:hypothetical protein
MRGCGNPLAVVSDVADEPKGNGRVICRDGVADVFKIQLGQAREANAHQR